MGGRVINCRIVERPAFEIIGRKTWISGQDSELFGRFWEQCRAEGLFEAFEQIGGWRAGPQTGGAMLGVSSVEADPANRTFYYWIAIERPEGYAGTDVECRQVPASVWAVFECRGRIPEAIVEAEMYAFLEWLPASDFEHANAPEMEVYPPGSEGQRDDSYTEFWLPIRPKVLCAL